MWLTDAIDERKCLPPSILIKGLLFLFVIQVIKIIHLTKNLALWVEKNLEKVYSLLIFSKFEILFLALNYKM